MLIPITKEQVRLSGQSNVIFIDTIPPNHCFVDKDEVLLHVSFQLLVNFIENELMMEGNFSPDRFYDFEKDQRDWFEKLRTPISSGDPEFNPNDTEINEQINLWNKEQAEAEEALLDLYKWWKFDRQEEMTAWRNDPLEGMAKLDDKEQEMLEKLVRYRRSMWS
jgi:hypothetical protein